MVAEFPFETILTRYGSDFKKARQSIKGKENERQQQPNSGTSEHSNVWEQI
jgi:hypothetical protein